MKSTKKFPNISYNLSQNFILNITELETLEKTALISSVVHFLNVPDIRKDFHRKMLTKDYYLVAEKVGEKIFRRIIICIKSRINDSSIMHFFIKSTVQFVVLQVCNFVDQIYIPGVIDNFSFNNLVMTNQGTINTEKTVQKILSSDLETQVSKFLFACQHFLGIDIVVHYYNNLSEVDKNLVKQLLKDQKNMALYFWMLEITDSREKLKSSIMSYKYENDENYRVVRSDDDDYFALQHIFLEILKNNFEMGAQYLWTNYISKMRERELILINFIENYITKRTHCSIVMYLIFQVNENELIEIFQRFGDYILKLLASNPRWKSVFFKVLDVLQYDFHDENFLKLLQDLTNLYFENLFPLSFDFLLKYFNKIPRSVKENMANESIDSRKFYKELLWKVFQEGKADVANLFFWHGNDNNVFNFFISDDGIDLFFSSIKKSHFEFVNKILRRITKTNDEIFQIKTKIFESKHFDVCSEFICTYNLKMADYFLKWCSSFVHSARIIQFKKSLPYINRGFIVRNILFPYIYTERDPLKYTDEFLLWCMRSELTADLVKKNILLHIHKDEPYNVYGITCYKEVKYFLLTKKFEYLHSLIDWIRYKFPVQRALGRKLLNDEELLKEILQQQDVLKFLKSFVDWFRKVLSIPHLDDGIKDFKLKILDQDDLFSFLIRTGSIQYLIDLVVWCEPSEKKLKEFRNLTYMKLADIPHSVGADELNDFLYWLNPSLPTMLAARSLANFPVGNMDFTSYFIRTILSRFTCGLTKIL